jgi:ubiquinone/menaquinone biosynthesis methyltransferase
VDFNEAMLRHARRRHPHTNDIGVGVNWMRGDAQALPFRTGTVDRVLIGFSTRNLSDLAAGLREMRRVLKPGGRLTILETGRPNHPLIRLGYMAILFTTTRVIGWLMTGRVWPFTYLAKSVQGFLTPEQCVALLTTCGFSARYHPLSFGIASLFLADKPV